MITDHPQRYTLANELHARPSAPISPPCRAAFMAVKSPKGATRDKAVDRAHLIELLDHFGAQHPSPGATHYYGEVGGARLKWESHTEFTTYTLFADGVSDIPFDGSSFRVFPTAWLEKMPGDRMTSALIRVEELNGEEELERKISDWFVAESVAVSRILDETAVVAGDFRIDPEGHMRFAVFVQPNTGARRVGRIVQRLTEIETYKTMSMLGLDMARNLTPQISEVEAELTGLVGEMTGSVSNSEETLKTLLQIAAQLEKLAADSSFRFGATGAYEALVHSRIEVLRERRFGARQTFNEFMMRRFDPAMRTVKSAEGRLKTIADRAIRAGDLLRTRVDVERSAQNQSLLESMDARAAMQLRLQRTVEGLSVVAISYYAVSLALYFLAPLKPTIGISDAVLSALVTPPVVAAVWFMVRRIRREVTE